ncbi:hypothetical protein LPJ56_001966 [Coemansia sp. RSA 2599]|nr:hypothetical protein LPJ56_001966 [Coemansia sp. RSA 2599]
MNLAIVTRALRPCSAIYRVPRATTALATRALAPVGLRAYSKIETTGVEEAGQLNPTEFHKYLQTRSREPRDEFMAEEAELLVSESFGADASLSKDSSSNAALHGSRGVNEEFAKQIHDLLSPTYGE